jgi:8-amino-7-oxononanoate synthase
MTDYIIKKLNERTTDSNKRQLSINDCPIDFVSNDYLGLARNNELFDIISKADYKSIINKNCSSGSRLLAGNSIQAQKLEKNLTGIFKSEAALLFNSGYAANQAVISAVAQKGDTVIYDSYAHVCLKEGAWLSRAESISFQHNNLEDLELKLASALGEKFIVIESVYSMDGDTAPIKEIIKLSKKYKAQIIIDEAHGTGVIGEKGNGLVCELGLENDFFARIYTFGKGMGVHGACVSGSQDLINFLINFGRTFIYTTALPIHSIFSIDAAFNYLSNNIQLQNDLRTKIELFNKTFYELFDGIAGIVKVDSNTAIQPIIIPGNEKIKHIASKLQENGYDVRAILSPTVKSGSERLRISIHTHNTFDDIKGMLNCLKRTILNET